MSLFVLVLSGCPTTHEDTLGCKNNGATNYNPNATIADNCSCRFDGIFPSCGIQTPSDLNIQPVQQQTAVWCWLAVGEMIFRYYGLPTVNGAGDYQCGIVAAVGYSMNGGCDACNINCGNCVRPAGDANMISRMISTYPKIACRELFNSGKTLKSNFVSNFLSPVFLSQELDNKRPVIAGINPGSAFVLPGNSQHVAIIKGYYVDSFGNMILQVNDPFPYWTTGTDPYLNAGAYANGDLSYQIPYANFVNGLKWNTAWYGIQW